MSIYAPIFRSLRSLSLRGNISACVCLQNSVFNVKSYSAKAPALNIVKEIDPHTGEIKKKKSVVVPKITLLSGDSLSITTLEEAQKIAKRRDLKLVKIVDLDAKSQRPVYKLMTGTEYHAEDLKQRELKKKNKQNSYIKGEKVLLINSKISTHDLENQIRKTLKWIDKMYEVRIVINSANSSDQGEKVYATFEKTFKEAGNEAKFAQKREKGSDLKFQILPPKKKSDGDSGNGL